MSGLPSVTEFQYFVTEISFLLLKFFSKILKFFIIFPMSLHQNAKICVKMHKNTEILAVCYWSVFPGSRQPRNVKFILFLMVFNSFNANFRNSPSPSLYLLIDYINTTVSYLPKKHGPLSELSYWLYFLCHRIHSYVKPCCPPMDNITVGFLLKKCGPVSWAIKLIAYSCAMESIQIKPCCPPMDIITVSFLPKKCGSVSKLSYCLYLFVPWNSFVSQALLSYGNIAVGFLLKKCGPVSELLIWVLASFDEAMHHFARSVTNMFHVF